MSTPRSRRLFALHPAIELARLRGRGAFGPAARWLWALLMCSCSAAISCSAADVAFTCDTDVDCQHGEEQGQCEPTANCSFSDFGCPSARRYGTYSAPELADQCVPSTAQISLGGHQSCAVSLDGQVRCWGEPLPGQQTGGSLAVLRQIAVLPAIKAMAVGHEHACAIGLTDRRVWCWGSNLQGQLGVAVEPRAESLMVEAATAGGPASLVAAGRSHACAVSRGILRCWGGNRHGQLGRASAEGPLPPAEVTRAPEDLVAIDAGDGHSCGQPVWGGLHCWGNNDRGQLAAPLETVQSSEPLALAFFALDFALGAMHSCAINTTGEILCWGDNTLGQLGRGPVDLLRSPTPLRVEYEGRWLTATRIVSGAGHSCALMPGGGVACWGDNRHGQLGPAAALVAGVGTPVEVTGLPAAADLSAGANHTCALAHDRRVWCWGQNQHGQLGKRVGAASAEPDPAVSIHLAAP